MKEKLHEQLSALVDDELVDAEQAMLVRQLGTDPALRERLGSLAPEIAEALRENGAHVVVSDLSELVGPRV